MMNNQAQNINQTKQITEKAPKNLTEVHNSSFSSTNGTKKGNSAITTMQVAQGPKLQEIKHNTEKPLYQTPYLVHETMNAYSTQYFMDNSAPTGNHEDQKILGITSNMPSFGFSIPVGGWK